MAKIKFLHFIYGSVDDSDFDVLSVRRENRVLGRHALAEKLKEGEVIGVLVPKTGVLKSYFGTI